MKQLRELDEQERKIVRELYRDPRISDNQLGKKTGIPVMTVNRKRKQLEKENLLRYFSWFDTGEFGTGMFKAKQLYVIKFKLGMKREQYLSRVEYDPKFMPMASVHISFSSLGEKDGHLALIMIIDGKTDSELVEVFNGTIIPHLRRMLGENCIEQITTTKMTHVIRRLHNYIPDFNMESGKIKKDWPDDWIFVDEGG
ncbi:winged helix-turn-helix domain-containing protein [Candidatus Woesearchaeota archaeon]|nr:winged helix-turn-helix domain-containing protein [Candidatus Woesearchaeota archaeon]